MVFTIDIVHIHRFCCLPICFYQWHLGESDRIGWGLWNRRWHSPRSLTSLTHFASSLACSLLPPPPPSPLSLSLTHSLAVPVILNVMLVISLRAMDHINRLEKNALLPFTTISFSLSNRDVILYRCPYNIYPESGKWSVDGYIYIPVDV